MRYILVVALVIGAPTALLSQTSHPHPKSLDEFKAAVQTVLDETGVPGAGIALVRLNGVE